MSERVETGGPAFPAPELGAKDFGQPWAYPGMTLRDYFAVKVMPACYAEYRTHEDSQGFDEGCKMRLALDAYAMADAMLKAREVQNGERK